jgi:hypothetical protein
MSVLIEAISVVVLRETIARRYDGGWPSFVANAVNRTLCADSEVARLGFMHPDDVSAYVAHLERRGFVFLGPTGEAVDIVVVDQLEGPTTPCRWIEFFHQELPNGGVVSAARLRGSQEKGLFCPDGWTFEHSLSKEHTFIPGTDLPKNMAFTGVEGNTFTIVDEVTGEELYIGRTSTLDHTEREPEPSDLERQQSEHDALWNEAWKLIEPYISSPLTPNDPKAVADVSRASELLGRVIALNSENWAAWWALGVARRALEDHHSAYAAFARAYGLRPDEIEVGRNLAGECLTLGYAQEAVNVTAAMVQLAPGDAGLISNHALALLIAADVEGALLEIHRSLALDPSDAVTQAACRYIERVHAGQALIPKTITG